MATVSTRIPASPDRVFAVLADGWIYSGWVVGTSHMRAMDANWPQVGSKLHHASGAWPAVVNDDTEVEAMTPDRSLVLLAKARPFGLARVTIELQPDGDSTTIVTMQEEPVAGPGKWLHNRATEALLTRRNTESLARLTALVLRPTEPLT